MKITKVNNIGKGVFKKGTEMQGQLYNMQTGALFEDISQRIQEANENTKKLYQVIRTSKTNKNLCLINRLINEMRQDKNNWKIKIDKFKQDNGKYFKNCKSKSNLLLKDEYDQTDKNIVCNIINYVSSEKYDLDDTSVKKFLEKVNSNVQNIINRRDPKNILSTIQNQIINYGHKTDDFWLKDNDFGYAYRYIFEILKDNDFDFHALMPYFDYIAGKVIDNKYVPKPKANIIDPTKMDPRVLSFFIEKLGKYKEKEDFQDKRHKDIREDKDAAKKRLIGKLYNILNSKLMEYGKIVYYCTDDDGKIIQDDLTSFDLEAIKAVETLTQKMNTALMYALGIIEGLKGSENKQRDFLRYFGGQSNFKGINIDFDNISKLCRNLRDSQFHYIPLNGNINLSVPVDDIEKLYNKECGNISAVVLKKYSSNNVFKFYQADTVTNHIKTLYGGAIIKSFVFVPSFKNIFSKLKTDKDFIKFKKDCECQTVTNDDTDFSQTLRFVLEDIYYLSFLPQDNIDSMKIKSAAASFAPENEHKKAFKDFKDKCLKYKGPFSEFAKELQVEFMRANSASQDGNNTHLSHYNLILRTILAKAFWKYVNTNFKFLLKPQYSNQPDAENTLQLDKLTESYKNIIMPNGTTQNTKGTLLAYYLMAKLIPPAQLNFLKGDFLKYKQFTEDIKRRAAKCHTSVGFIDKITSRFKVEDVLNILSLCQYTSGQVSQEFTDYYKDKDEYVKFISDFLEVKCNNFAELKKNYPKYTDDENPVIFAQIEKSRMYCTEHIIKDVYKAKIKSDDFIRIAQIEKYALYKKFYLLGDPNSFSGPKEWEETIKRKTEYDHILGKTEFNNIQRLSDLLLDLYSPLISWCYMWERDMEFFLLAVANINNQSIKDIKNIFVYKSISIYKGNTTTDKLNKYKKGKENLFRQLKYDKLKEITDLRNSIDHWDYFQKGNGSKSILELYKKIYCNLLAYSKKLQNNVYPKIIDILADNKIVWQHYENKPNKEHIVKNNEYKTDFLSKDVVSSVYQLLSGDKNKSLPALEPAQKLFRYNPQKGEPMKLQAKLISDKCTYKKPFANTNAQGKAKDFKQNNMKPKKVFENRQQGFTIGDICRK